MVLMMLLLMMVVVMVMRRHGSAVVRADVWTDAAAAPAAGIRGERAQLTRRCTGIALQVSDVPRRRRRLGLDATVAVAAVLLIGRHSLLVHHARRQ